MVSDRARLSARSRARPGRTGDRAGYHPGVIEGDQVSDVLVQHAARDKSVPGHIIGEPTWLLLIEQATPEACRQIADVAYEQRQEHQAPITERAIRKAAATTGHAGTMSNVGVLLQKQGEDGEAEEWYRKAAATEGQEPS